MHYLDFFHAWPSVRDELRRADASRAATFAVVNDGNIDSFELPLVAVREIQDYLRAGNEFSAMQAFAMAFAETNAGKKKYDAKYYNCEMCEAKRVLSHAISVAPPRGADEEPQPLRPVDPVYSYSLSRRQTVEAEADETLASYSRQLHEVMMRGRQAQAAEERRRASRTIWNDIAGMST